MPLQHTVKEGEHLSRIAAQYGFPDYRKIWDLPDNAGLKAKRKDPHVLNPGDCVAIPDREQRIENCATDQKYTFVLRETTLKLRLLVRDFDDKPVAGTPCELQVEGTVYKLTTDGAGKIEVEVPKTAENGHLRVPARGIDTQILIGHLDPHTERSGWVARLSNLGYDPGSIGASDTEQLCCAIEEFQCDQHLPVTGKLDDATAAKLHSLHGL